MDEKMDKGFKQVNNRIDGVQEDMNGLKGEMKGVKEEMNAMKESMNTMSTEIDNLQLGQEGIEERPDEIVPEMKEQKEILKERDQRITVLEKKAFLAR
jgi:chromosome segregation ATPase